MQDFGVSTLWLHEKAAWDFQKSLQSTGYILSVQKLWKTMSWLKVSKKSMGLSKQRSERGDNRFNLSHIPLRRQVHKRTHLLDGGYESVDGQSASQSEFRTRQRHIKGS